MPAAPAVTGDLVNVANFVWDTGALAWVKETQAGGGGGGAVTIADGADVAQGSTGDAPGANTVIGQLKQIASAGPGGSGAGSVNVLGTVSVAIVSGGGAGAGSVNVLNNVTVIVSGTPTVLQGGAPWQVAGSVAATQGGVWNVGLTGTPTVLQGNAPWQVAGSVAATQGGTWNVGITGTPTVLQGTPPWQVAGSVAVTGLGSVNVINNIQATISGIPTVDVRSVGLSSVSVVGTVNVAVTGQPISVTSAPSGTPESTFVAGTVTALIGAGTNTLGSVNVSSGHINVIGGEIPTGSPFTANPLPDGGRAMLTNPVPQDDSDIAAISVDKLGKQINYPFSPRLLSAQLGSTTSGTGETTFIAAGSTGVFHDLAMLVLANLGSLSSPIVTIRDRTGGPVIFRIALGPFQSENLAFTRPWEQQVAASPWTMQLSAAGGSVFVAGQVVKLI